MWILCLCSRWKSRKGDCTRPHKSGENEGYSDGHEEDESDEYDNDYSFGGHYADDDDDGGWDKIMRNS